MYICKYIDTSYIAFSVTQKSAAYAKKTLVKDIKKKVLINKATVLR